MYAQAPREDRLKRIQEALQRSLGASGFDTSGLHPESLAEAALTAVEMADRDEHDRKLQEQLDRRDRMRRDIEEGRAISK